MIHDPRGIFEVIVSSCVLANKAYHSETKIENKYRQCTILKYFESLVFRKVSTKFSQRSHEHACTC